MPLRASALLRGLLRETGRQFSSLMCSGKKSAIYLSKGYKAAVDHVKRIERKREHDCHIYTTYGYLTLEDPRTYLYCKQIRCKVSATLSERTEVFKEFMSYMKQIGGKVEQSTQCCLDGRYRPVNIEKKYLTADFSHPVVIRLIIV